jgi:hypothetical protein
LFALAPACGGSPAAGVRIEIGGASGGAGSGGSTGSGGGATGAGSGGSIGSGGTSPGAGGGGSLVDAGPLPPFDGGACTDNVGGPPQPNMTAATGTFSGALGGTICAGGAFAYVQSMAAADGGAPQVELFIVSDVAGAAASSIRFQSPAGVTGGQLFVEIGLPAAAPGTYPQAATCGNVVLTANLPAPDASICATDADTLQCPDGCELAPSLPPTCQPIKPQLTYAALGSSDCVGDATTPVGSWTLALTSLTVDPAGVDSSGVLAYAPHGTLSATLADESADAGTGGVTISLVF